MSSTEKSALFSTWCKEVQCRIEATLDRKLPPADCVPTRLHEAMRYACLGGGKRIRTLLAFAAGELSDANPLHLETVAGAVELIHAYSLVHDDLPCMDNDVLRRGRPTCHIAFDEATALLVGDALQSLAFDWLAEGDVEPSRQVAMLRILAIASGSRGMAGGQAIDLASVGHALSRPELEQMHGLKTGALISAAIHLGFLCGDVEPALGHEKTKHALDVFAKCVGLLFQVVDDILDCTASTEALGKTAGKDAKADKPTYVSLLGLDGAKALAQDLKDEAILSVQIFGEKAARLCELAEFFAARQH